MSQEWYYSVDGDRQGPVAAADLKKLAEAGTLKPADLVWKDGMADWVQAKSIKGLFGAGSAQASAAAPKAGEPKARPTDEEDRPARARRRDDDEEEDEDDRPRRRRDEDDEGEDRPARARRRDDDEDDDDDRRVRRRDDDEEDEDDDRPRKRRRKVPEDVANTKMVSGLLGILLGGLAIHKFYLGFTGTAVIQLVISIFTCGLGGWLGIIEGIIYLTKSDEDFYQTYIVEQKQWF